MALREPSSREGMPSAPPGRRHARRHPPAGVLTDERRETVLVIIAGRDHVTRRDVEYRLPGCSGDARSSRCRERTRSRVAQSGGCRGFRQIHHELTLNWMTRQGP